MPPKCNGALLAWEIGAENGIIKRTDDGRLLMLVLIMILAATYITLTGLTTFGYGLLMSRTSSNVKAVLRAEEWRLSRSAKSSPGFRDVEGPSTEHALVGARGSSD